MHVNCKNGDRSLIRRFAAVQLSAALAFLALFSTSVHLHASNQGLVSPIAGPVATAATCGRHDRPESGVQGFDPLQDRYAAGVPRAFNCNLDLIGQARGDGAELGMAITDRCIFYSQNVATNVPVALEHPGIVVVDAVDPKDPKIVNHLDITGAIDTAQSIAVSQKRKLLITGSVYREESGRMVLNKPGPTIDIFDVSDCTHPVLKFSGLIPSFYYHTGEFSADGNTFWAASGPYLPAGSVSALDVSDPSHPKLFAQWHAEDSIFNYFHGVSVSDDGKTVYVAGGNNVFRSDTAFSWKELNKEPPQGVFLLDASEVQSRKPNAKIRGIGHLYWNDVTSPQYVYPMTIKGHKYLWFVDLMGSLSTFDVAIPGRNLGSGAMPLRGFTDPDASSAPACRRYPTRPGWGYISIVDIDNPARPVRVSGIRLAVDDPKNCASEAPQPRLRGYMGMYCDVDNYQDGRMMACSLAESGVRVFDIRDVRHPREIAYYKPPAAGAAVRKASGFQAYLDDSGTLQGSYHGADMTGSLFFANGDKQIWFTSIDNGAQIVGFSKELMQREKNLFTRDNSCKGKLRDIHGC
jgi:hypothetical protein